MSKAEAERYRAELDEAWKAAMADRPAEAQRVVDAAAAEIDTAEDWTGYLTWSDLAPFYGQPVCLSDAPDPYGRNA